MTDFAVDWLRGGAEPAGMVSKWYIVFTGAAGRLCL